MDMCGLGEGWGYKYILLRRLSFAVKRRLSLKNKDTRSTRWSVLFSFFGRVGGGFVDGREVLCVRLGLGLG